MSKITGLYLEKNVWRVRKKYKGVDISFTRPTKNEALEEMKRRIKAIDDKLSLNISLDKQVVKITVSNVFIEYFEKQDSRWKANTREYNEKLFKNHFAIVKDILISNLTDYDISKWVTSIKRVNEGKDGRELSNIPYRAAALFKQVLQYAISRKYCSPLLDLTFVNSFNKVNNVSKKTEENYINYSEFKLLCNAIKKITQNNKAQNNLDVLFLIEFLYYTGTRISEARAVQVKDITYKDINTATGIKRRYYVDIYKQFGDNNYVLDNTLKNQTPCRKVLIKAEVYNKFIEHIERNGFTKDNYIFDFKKEEKPLYRTVISNNIKRVINESKVSGLLPESFVDELSPHGFRYSNTIYLKNILKVTVEMAAKNQGHTVTVMQNTYARIDKDEANDIFAYDL